MPVHGPRYRQRSRNSEGLMWTSTSNSDFPSGVSLATQNYAHVSAPAYVTPNCASCPARASEQFTLLTGWRTHSFIKDYKNSRDLDGQLPVASVIHEKVTAIAEQPLIPWRHTCCGGFGNQVVTPAMECYPHITRSIYGQAMFIPSVSVLQNLCDEAFNSFNTQFPTELSVANFIWELREIVGLIPKLSKSIMKSAANGYLTLQFGWLPLISDIQAMMHVLERVRARIAWLQSTAGHHTQLGKQATNFVSPPWSNGTSVIATMHASGLRYRYVLSDYSITFHAKGRLFHNMGDLDGMAGLVTGLLGAFGFNNPALIVWEAIPYSFVVDWLFNIQELIQRFGTLQDLSSQWRIDRLCWSIKTSARVAVYQQSVSGSGALYWETLRSSFLLERYDRNPGLSVSSSLLTLVSPTFKQQVLLAALLTGKS